MLTDKYKVITHGIDFYLAISTGDIYYKMTTAGKVINFCKRDSVSKPLMIL